ncbi:MAG: response regulator transcription factor [Dehalococcoidales bacterium]|nr:response regulator transcription factor [Dehalococcoidales bacterium]
MKDIRVLLAEDHLVTRQGIRQLIDAEKGLKVVGEANNGEEAVKLATELNPDVILMDIAMPVLNGIEATKRIKEKLPRVAVLILSAYDNDEFVFAVLRAGAAGYLLKSVSGDGLIQAIRAVCKGEPVLDPVVARKVMDFFKTPSDGRSPAKESEHLTSREIDILKLAARGMSNKSIAAELELSKRTVEGHFRTIFNKLGVGSRTEAVLFALKKGWFKMEDLS